MISLWSSADSSVSAPADDYLFQLVEEVDAVEPARVLARRAGFTPEAGAAGDVALGQFVGFENLVAVIAGDRNFGRPDQALIIALAAIDLLLVQREEAGAVHQPVGDKDGDGQRRIAALHHCVPGEPQHGLVQHGACAAEHVVARAGDLHAALHIDHAERHAEFEMVLELEAQVSLVPGLAMLADLDIFGLVAAARGVGVGDLRDAQHQFVELALNLLALAVERLQTRLHSLELLAERGLLILAGPGHLLAGLLLLVA